MVVVDGTVDDGGLQHDHLQSPRRIDHLRCRVDVIDRQLGRPKVVPVPSCVITIRGLCLLVVMSHQVTFGVEHNGSVEETVGTMTTSTPIAFA